MCKFLGKSYDCKEQSRVIFVHRTLSYFILLNLLYTEMYE